MNGLTREKIGSRVAELEKQPKAVSLALVVAMQEHMSETMERDRTDRAKEFDGLPCNSNDPKVNPQQRIAVIGERVDGINATVRKGSAATAGGVSVILIGAIEAVKRVFGL